MSVFAALQAFSASGAFASRAFLPLFLVGAIARWPRLVNWIPLVPDRPVVLSEQLAWLASPWCLVALAILALLEAHAERDPDARRLLQEIDAPIKGIVAFLAAFALLDAESVRVLRTLGAGFDVPDAATLVAALACGALTFGLAWWRSLVLREARDVADDLGLTKPVAWLEEAWSATGILFALLAPLLAIVLALAGFALLRLVQHGIERADDARRLPCGACRHPCLPDAAACASCGAALAPRGNGTGLPWPDRIVAPASREAELLGRGRCPSCAERRDSASLLAMTPHACGWPRAAGDAAWPGDLLASVRARIAPLALMSAALGLLPIAGSAAALVLCRARIAAPLRRHLGTGRRLRTQWIVRLASVPLLLGSGIPLVSAACAAGLVALSGACWSRAFEAGVTPPAPRDPRA